MDISYLLAFVTGFLGGFGHCIGMCGPIVAAYSLQRTFTEDIKKQFMFNGIIPHMLYSAGRISTYMFIGGLMGLTGSFVNISGKIVGIQGFISIAAGIFMMVMGLGIIGVWRGFNILEKHNNFVLKLIKVFAFERSAWRYYPIGILMGFLPCGLSYSVFVASAGTGNVMSGITVSAMFGFGTLPALLSFGTIITYLGAKIRGIIYRASGIVVTMMGIYFIMRAAGINV